MKKFFIALIVLFFCERDIVATKMTPESIIKFNNIFKTEGFTKIEHEIDNSILLDPDLPQSWAGYSATQNISKNIHLTSDEKKEAIKMILEKAPSSKEIKRIKVILRKIK